VYKLKSVYLIQHNQNVFSPEQFIVKSIAQLIDYNFV